MNKKTGIIVGLVAAIVLIVGIVVTVVIVNKFNEMNDEIQDLKEDNDKEKESNKKSFQTLDVTIELGESLSRDYKDYVVPGVNDDPEEYDINLSEVNVYEVGDYSFTVTYKGKKKTGKISVQDTTPPVLEVKNVTIKEGEKVSVNSFISSCTDYSGCSYSFKDKVNDYSKPGTYDVYVVAFDNYKNEVTKKATLVVEAKNPSFSNLKEINIDELENMLKKKDSFILVITQSTCSACVSYKPKLENVLKKHKLKAYFIEKDLLNEDERTRLNNIANISGTPTTIFIKDGEEENVAHRLVGNRDESVIEERLKNLGYIK